MKLKISRVLRASLVACYALAAPIATTVSSGALAAVATLGLLAPQAQAAENNDDSYTLTASGDMTIFADTDSDDYHSTVIIDISSKYLGSNADSTCYATSLVINSMLVRDGWSNRTLTFVGDVSGEGDITFTYPSSSNYLNTYGGFYFLAAQNREMILARIFCIFEGV